MSLVVAMSVQTQDMGGNWACAVNWLFRPSRWLWAMASSSTWPLGAWQAQHRCATVDLNLVMTQLAPTYKSIPLNAICKITRH
jgi:hypothetical protein